MLRMSKIEFVRQQGFSDVDEASSYRWHNALMFQPRLLSVLILSGLALQSWSIFLMLCLLLVWNALVPARNPFDFLYNRLVAIPRKLPLLGAAPVPRRFAQGESALVMLAISAALLMGWHVAAWTMEGALLAVLAALLIGNFCSGTWIFHLFADNGHVPATGVHR
jgi:hypothetical protein